MNQIKKAITLSVFVFMLVITPVCVYAASGTYVPTKAKNYRFDGKKWVPDHEVAYKYKKDGRITESVFKSLEYNSTFCETTKYKWKGNYLAKIEEDYSKWKGNHLKFDDNYYNYEYRKNKIMSIVSYCNMTSDKTEKTTYKWKKKKASYKHTFGTTGTIEIDSKGRMIKNKLYFNKGGTYYYTYKYYKNGNLKEYTKKNSEGSISRKIKYNQQGYPTSVIFNGNTTYTYKKKNGKIIEQIETTKTADGYINKKKTVYSNWKKVRRVRNCDAFGFFVETPYYELLISNPPF